MAKHAKPSVTSTLSKYGARSAAALAIASLGILAAAPAAFATTGSDATIESDALTASGTAGDSSATIESLQPVAYVTYVWYRVPDRALQADGEAKDAKGDAAVGSGKFDDFKKDVVATDDAAGESDSDAKDVKDFDFKKDDDSKGKKSDDGDTKIVIKDNEVDVDEEESSGLINVSDVNVAIPINACDVIDLGVQIPILGSAVTGGETNCKQEVEQDD